MGTLKCHVKHCPHPTITYPEPKYVDGTPNRIIGIRRHYARYHPILMSRWHKSIKHPHSKKKKGR